MPVINWSSKRVQGVLLIVLGLALDVLDREVGLRMPSIPTQVGSALTLYGTLYTTGAGWLMYGAVDAAQKAKRAVAKPEAPDA